MVIKVKVSSTDRRFAHRAITITSLTEPRGTTRIPVPDSVVLCNGCNKNVSEGYLIYLDKRNWKADLPYDIYCEKCVSEYFPKAELMEAYR